MVNPGCAEHVIRGGVHGLLALGSTGETASLDETARRKVLARVVSAAGGRVPVICGVAQSQIAAARVEVDAAARLGAYAALVAPPFYYLVDQATILAAFANTPAFGGGMKIAPKALMGDGLLDVCIVGGVAPFKLFCMFPSVYSGNHLKIREVEYFKTRKLRVETEHPLAVYADGELVCRTPVEVGVHPAALQVVTA